MLENLRRSSDASNSRATVSGVRNLALIFLGRHLGIFGDYISDGRGGVGIGFDVDVEERADAYADERGDAQRESVRNAQRPGNEPAEHGACFLLPSNSNLGAKSC